MKLIMLTKARRVVQFVIGLGRPIVVIAVLLLGTVVSRPARVLAQISDCSASVSPNTVGAVSNGDIFEFQITNTSGQTVHWLRVTRPSANFFVNGVSNLNISGVSADTSNDSLTLSGSGLSIGPGQSLTVDVMASVGLNQAAAASWQVELSDSNNGLNPTTCTGPLDTTIAGHAVPDDQFNIDDEIASDITTDSATITWSSTPATTLIFYSEDLSYANSTDPDPDTEQLSDHSVTLTNLKPGTSYHFQVAGAYSDGRPFYSSDSVFSTLATISTDPTSNDNNPPVNTIVPIKVDPGDKTPPTIHLSTTFSQPFAVEPEISGSASDNTALATVEYSLDGGKNWLPVDKASGLGGKKADFSFTPRNLEDGNFQVLARAVDTAGNIGRSTASTFVIDRLPPLVGGAIVSLGPQTLESDTNQAITVLAGIPEKVTLSAVGGPTSITLAASNSSHSYDLRFSLTESSDLGLWSGTINFTQPGTYSVVANSVDGAGNKTTRALNQFVVTSSAKILQQNGKPADATVTAFYQDPELNDWVKWDGEPYGQSNPQKTASDGTFKLFLPAGTYYLSASGKDINTITSSIFTAKSPTAITATLQSKGGHSVLKNMFSRYSTVSVKLTPLASSNTTKNSLINNQAPDFKLKNIDGQTINTVDLLGRPTVLSFMSSWAPTTSEQLPALQELSSNKDINVYAVALQQNISEIKAFKAISGYNVNWLADPDSTTSDSFSITNLPMHYFIDRRGVVKQVISGVLSKQELINMTTGL